MSTRSTTELYSAEFFGASPTWRAWVKLTAADVQALYTQPGFQGQHHVYFHLNHPIQYVRLVGVVVAIDDINLKYTVLTIDDGSGANIELKIVRHPSSEKSPLNTSSSTALENVTIMSQLGVFQVIVDNHALDIGTVVKAKGTISEFRGIKQLELKRIWVVTTTDEEAQAWAETAAFKQKYLSKPWYLSPADQKRIRKNKKLEDKKVQDYQRRKAEYEIKKEERRQARELIFAQREKKLEKRRQNEEVILNAGSLI